MANIEVINVAQVNPEAPIEIQLHDSNIIYRGPAGQAGQDGQQGKSAYEVAVDNGFVGSQSEWLASLKGEPGQDGTIGTIGPQGPKGDTPVKGVDYFTAQDIEDIVAQIPVLDPVDYKKDIVIDIPNIQWNAWGSTYKPLTVSQQQTVFELYQKKKNGISLPHIWVNEYQILCIDIIPYNGSRPEQYTYDTIRFVGWGGLRTWVYFETITNNEKTALYDGRFGAYTIETDTARTSILSEGMTFGSEFVVHNVEDALVRLKEWKQDALEFNTDYNPTTNKVATMTDISSAIEALAAREMTEEDSEITVEPTGVTLVENDPDEDFAAATSEITASRFYLGAQAYDETTTNVTKDMATSITPASITLERYSYDDTAETEFIASQVTVDDAGITFASFNDAEDVGLTKSLSMNFNGGLEWDGEPIGSGEGGGTYTAGENITISNGVISAQVPTYRAGSNITIGAGNTISSTVPNDLSVTSVQATSIQASSIQTGGNASSYFQCQKFRGEGDANTYYHAIDFGYQNHDQVDFYEYGGTWTFYMNQDADTSNKAELLKITPRDVTYKGQSLLTNVSYLTNSDILAIWNG